VGPVANLRADCQSAQEGISILLMSGEELGSLYTRDELSSMLGSVGVNVAVNRSVVFYSPKNIHVGSNVRIDCFSLLSAGSQGIVIGDYVHIAAYGALFGSGGKIHMESFSGLSSRVTVYTSTDDYVDGFMSNPPWTRSLPRYAVAA
jgi:dTDP-4-amino-4,6-dideoxy-D-glucose acyltransferase